MKYILSLILCIWAVLMNTALPQQWVSSLSINATQIDPKVSAIDNNNNVILLSFFTDTLSNPFTVSYGLRDLLVTKIDPSGEILWSRRIGNVSSDIPGGIDVDNQNNIYISGAYYNNTLRFTISDTLKNNGNGDIFLAKYDQDGNLQWAKQVSFATTLESSLDIKFDKSNQLIMSGFFKDSLIIGSSSSNTDTLIGNNYNSHFIASFSAEGNFIWSKKILGSNNLSRIVKVGTSESGYYFGGYFAGNMSFDIGTITSFTSNYYDAFVYKTDFNGNGLWIRRIRGQNHENFRSLALDEYDNVYLLGNFNSMTVVVDSTDTETKSIIGNTGGYDTYVTKFNRSGILQWFLRKGSTAKDIYNDFVVRNNVIYATGYFTNQIIFNNDTLRTSSSLNSDAFVAAFNQIGDPISGVSIVGTGNYEDAGTIVNMDRNSRAYVSGYYKSPQIQIGSQTYPSNNINKSDLFFAIYQQPLKAVITDEKMATCKGSNDGMLKVTPYFGRPPYRYSWSHNPGLNSDRAENLPAGDFTVTVTDANNQVASITGRIIEPALFEVQALITPVTCNNGQDGAINITAAGGNGNYSYFWTTLDGSGISPLLEDQTGLSAGTYTVIVEDKKKCSATANFTVTEPGKFNYAGTKITNVTTPPGNNGAIDLKPAGGNAPYTFAWTGPDGFSASTEDLANLASGGLYKLTITDAGMCTSDTSFLVNDSFTMIAQIVKKTDVSCFNGNNGTATVRVTNGTPPYTYDWGPLGTIIDSTQIGLTARDYIVTVRDSESKVASATVSILQPSADLTIVLDPDDLFCNGDNSGVIDLTVSGGTLPYSYSWNTGYKGEDLVNVAAGVYTATVTDANGCTTQDTKEVKQPESLGLIIELSGQILCYGDRSAIGTAKASGGTPPGSYTYQWDDPGTQTTQVAYDLGAGTWHCKVTDGNNCSITGEITILQPEELSITAVVEDPSCAGLSDGSIIPTPSGGTGTGYEYVWSNNVYHRFNSNIPAGQYTLTLNDANNCVLVETYSLTDPEAIDIESVIATDPVCYGQNSGSLEIVASGGYGSLEYSIDGGAHYVSGPIFSSLIADDYQVAVRDENKCTSDILPINLNQSDQVSIVSIEKSDITCNGISDGSITITVAGGNGTYRYSIDGGNNFVTESTIGSLAHGNYNVVVKDGTECLSDIQPVTINNAEAVRIETIEISDITCNGLSDGSIEITAAGGTVTYSYSFDGGNSFVPQSTKGSLAHGDYNLVVKDGNECLSAIQTATINNAEEVRIANIETSDITCYGSTDASITITAEGGNGTYGYSVDGGNSFVPQSTIGSLTHGNYIVVVKDGNECLSEVHAVTINNAEEVKIASIETSDLSCSGNQDGSVTITAEGGSGNYSYSIDGGNNFVTEPIFGSLAQGDYDVVVRDGNECLSDIQTVTISNSSSVRIVNIETSDLSCSGNQDGSITITAEGGSGNYSYSIDGGNNFVTEPIFGSLAQGDYDVVVRDGNECLSDIQTVIISNSSSVRIVNIETSDLSCSGNQDGSVTITAEGGSGNYQYSIDGGNNFVTESTIGSLEKGDYNVVVKDENECMSEVQTVTINSTGSVSIVNIETSDLSCSGIADGSITITAEGGSGNYQYSIDDGNSFVTESTIGSLEQGDYNVVVKDENDCLSDVSNVTLVKEEVCGLIIYGGLSPNDDGKNDDWIIGNVENFPNIKVTIFNMWGKIVFSSKGYGTAWDGTFNGNDLPAGTYYYIIDPGDGSGIITGDVSLVK